MEGINKMTKKIIRVFPHKTSYTPTDSYAFIGMPTLFIPEHDEVHVSCTFTWDKKICEELQYQWQAFTDKPVKLGGVAFNSPVKGFVQGMYNKSNIVYTTRGCNNNCKFCLVPHNEGKLVELPICEGNIIQDNNFLQASRLHKDKVFEMLRHQRQICFKGGLQASLIDDHFIDNITSLRVKELWLACDSDGSIPAMKKACRKLTNAGFNRNKIYCYALSYGKDMQKDEARMVEIFNAGAMPFCQLYRDFSEVKTEYPRDWNNFQRNWSRPALIKARMKEINNAK